MGLVESLPVQRVRPVLYLPLWLGTLRDYSGYGNHGTESGAAFWATNGSRDAADMGANGTVTVADSPSLRSTEWTWFISGNNWDNYNISDRIVSKRDVGGTQFDIRKDSGVRFGIYDGTAAPFALWTPTKETRTVCFTLADGVSAALYVDGVYSGPFSAPSVIAENDADLLIGNYWNAGYPNSSPVDVVLGYAGTLTPAEIASLHLWSQRQFTPRKQWPGGGLDIPTLSGAANEPMFLDNIQSARVTLSNETSGKLSNTDFAINTGTWAIREDDDGRYIYCVGAGQLQYDLVGADGYTTAAFVETGGATLTKNATNFQIDAGNGDIVRAVRLSA